MSNPGKEFVSKLQNMRSIKIKTLKKSWIPTFVGMTELIKWVLRRTPKRGFKILQELTTPDGLNILLSCCLYGWF
jgi:hypothetical protein